MRILCFAPYLPYEGVLHAGGEFLLRHLEEVSRTHQVTLVVPRSPEARTHLSAVPPWLTLSFVDVLSESPSHLQRLLALAERACRYPPTIDRQIRRQLEKSGFLDGASNADIIELHWEDSALIMRDLRRAGVSTPIALVAYDLNSEVHASLADSPRTLFARARSTLLRQLRDRMEKRDLSLADLLLVFKDRDEARIRRLGVATSTYVLEPPIDFPPSGAKLSTGPNLLFTGAMHRNANSRGVAWFIEEVWPQIREVVPSAILTIAGAEPPTWLRNLADAAPGVALTGRVPSLEPYYLEATGFVAPLFTEGGLKFKVVQALAYGLPVIATPTAAAGIVETAPPGTFWSVTEDAHEMALAAIALLQRPSDAAQVGEKAAAWVRDRYSFDKSTRAVVDLYQRLQHSGSCDGRSKRSRH